MPSIIVSVCLGAALLAAQAFSQPSITVEANVVTIRGVTPGGRVAWLGVAREQPEYFRTTIIRRDGVLVDRDRDGIVSITLTDDVPASSVWIAVDVSSGQAAAVAADPLFDLPLEETLASAGKAGAGLVELAADRHDYLEVLFVRPAVGAWRASAGDGGVSDGDGAPDGRIQLLAGAMTTLGDSPGLVGPILAGDVITYVDVRTLEYGIAPLELKW